MANLQVNFTANTSGFSKGISLVKNSIGGLAATVGAIMAPLAALVGVGAALGAAFKGVGLAAEMEGFEASFSTILGSGEDAKKVLADINKLAAQTPFALTELVGAARSLLSVTDKEGLTNTLKMVGDLSSASQKPLGELASMYSKILGGDVVQGEDLNMIGDALGGGALKEFARVLGVDSVKAVRKLGSEGKITGANLQTVFENLTAKGGMAFGAMEAQSRTFNGLLSTLKDNWDALLREFGKPIMEALKPFLQDGISLLENLQAKARSFGETVGRAITVLRNAFKGGEIVSLASSGLALAAQTFVNILVKGFVAAGNVLLNAFEAAGSLIAGIFTNSAMWDGLKAQFDVVGLTIQRAIVSALPDNLLGGKDKALAHIDGLKASRESAAENYGSASARINGQIFSDAGSTLKESGRIFKDAFQNTPQLFNTAERLKALQERWNTLSKSPATAPAAPAAAGAAKGTAAQPKAKEAIQAQFQPILSSLAKIGGARSLTGNPLVSLQEKANGYLETIARNSGKSAVAVLG